MKKGFCYILYTLSLMVFMPLAVIGYINDRLGTTLVSVLLILVSTKMMLRKLKTLNADKKDKPEVGNIDTTEKIETI